MDIDWYNKFNTYIIIYFLISYCFNHLFEVFKFLLFQTLNDRNIVLYTSHILEVKLLFQRLCSLKKFFLTYQFFLIWLQAFIYNCPFLHLFTIRINYVKKDPFLILSFIITEAKHFFPYLFPISNSYFVNDPFLSFILVYYCGVYFFLMYFLLFSFFAFTNIRGICTCQALMWTANNFLHLNDNFIISSHLCTLHFYVFNLLDCHLIASSFDTAFRLIISTQKSY